eukprot:scaffold106297_cov17-Prasinocladus_malaysianus.AAC.1
MFDYLRQVRCCNPFVARQLCTYDKRSLSANRQPHLLRSRRAVPNHHHSGPGNTSHHCRGDLSHFFNLTQSYRLLKDSNKTCPCFQVIPTFTKVGPPPATYKA